MNDLKTNQVVASALEKVTLLRKSGELKLAEQVCSHLVKTYPKLAAAWYQLGLVYEAQKKWDNAVASVTNAVSIDSENFVYHRYLCIQFGQLRKFKKAVFHGEQAIKFGRQDSESYFAYGIALAEVNKTQEAIRSFKRAIEFSPNLIGAYLNITTAYSQMNDLENAKKYAKKAYDINPNLSDTQFNLAMVKVKEGDIYKGRIYLEKMLENHPFHINAHFKLSALKKYKKGDADYQLLEKIGSDVHKLRLNDQIKYWFTVGKAREDVSEYNAAFSAYSRGNTMYRNTFKYDVERARSEVLSSLNLVSKRKDLDLISKDNSSPIFIVGMPRSGSTLIEQILDSHSKVFGAGEIKDLGICIDGVRQGESASVFEWLKQATKDQLQTIAERYLNSIQKYGSGEQIIVNKTPGNIVYIDLILKLFPGAKIICSRRDPMDTCISNYKQLFNDGQWFSYNMEELGKYCRLCDDVMAFWDSQHADENILMLNYEDLVEDFDSYSRQLIKFVGLEWEDGCAKFYQNKRAVQTASLNQVNKPIYKSSVNKSEKYAGFIQPMKDGYSHENQF